VRYLSVCSGIEAATVAWHDLGWEPLGFSEIEPFPSAVLKHHYPNTPNLGDMTKYKEWDIGTIDLLVGGTPCQSFSVAGLRKGLDDPRGNLALVYCGILDHFRPKWFVWENVPGVLSSAGGRDFGSFLGAVAQLGYGFAYRVLDAQFFGVAQRRRRVFVVGYLGDWRPAAAVLFERESLRRDTAPSREKGQNASSRTTHGLGAGGECARALTAHPSATGRLDPHEMTFVSHTLRAEYDASEDGTGRGTPLVPVGIPDVMSTLLSSTAGISRPGNAATEHETYIPMAQPMCFQQNTRDEVRYINGDGQIAGALAAEAGMKQQNYVAQPISIHPHCIGRSPEAGPQGKEYLLDGSAYCMDSRGQPQAVAQPINIYGGNKRSDRPEGGFYVRMDEETTKTLDAASGLNPTCSQGGTAVMQAIAPALTASNDPSRSPQSSEVTQQVAAVHAASMAVRRLTPVECERLQGFPDNYTAIPWRGKTETPDGPRYKALGNSMAVPVMRWIGKRINQVNRD
jgi:DNA (cytosine-5)-methyltransferase 1